jgi:Ca2+-binding EF-hand superfamily protein
MRKLVIVMLAVTLVIGLALIVQAQEKPKQGEGTKPPRPEMPLPPQQLPEELVKEFDKDGDGKLSPDELKAAREELHKRMLKEFDKDGDGKLSDAERQAMNESMRAKFVEEFFKKTDTDASGELSLDELKAAVKKIEDLKKEAAEKKGEPGDSGKQPGTPPPPGKEGEKNPPTPSPQPAPAGRPGHGQRGPMLPAPGRLLGRLVKEFDNLDKNKSGGLSLEEVKSAFNEAPKRTEKGKPEGQTTPVPQGKGTEEGKQDPQKPCPK